MGASGLSQLATAAYHFVTVKKADPKAHYTYEKAPGQIVLLQGKAKEYAIQVEDLKNQKARLKNVYNLCSTLVGLGLSLRAWTTQSYLPLVIWTPLMTLGHNLLWRKLESYNPLIAALNVAISVYVPNEPPTSQPKTEGDWVYVVNKSQNKGKR